MNEALFTILFTAIFLATVQGIAKYFDKRTVKYRQSILVKHMKCGLKADYDIFQKISLKTVEKNTPTRQAGDYFDFIYDVTQSNDKQRIENRFK